MSTADHTSWAPLGNHRYSVDEDLLTIELSGGDFTKVATGHKETTTDLTNASTIQTIKSSASTVTPVAGDLIMRVAPVGSVSGTVLVEQHLAYQVDA